MKFVYTIYLQLVEKNISIVNVNVYDNGIKF
jgi:hypothetical protein